MAYDPATGNVVDVNIGGLAPYTPPAGSVVDLQLRDPLVPVAYSTDVSWHVLGGGSQELEWRVLAGGSQAAAWHVTTCGICDLAWAIRGGGAQGLSWHVLKAGSQGLGWRLLAGGSQALSWAIEDRVYIYGSTELAWHVLFSDFQALRWNVDALPRIIPGLYGFGTASYGQASGRLRSEPGLHWVDPPPTREEYRVAFAAPDELRCETGSPWSVPANVKVETGAAFRQAADHLRGETVPVWEDPAHRRAEAGVATGRAPDRFRRLAEVPWAAPPARRGVDAIPWEAFKRLRIEREEDYTDATRRSLTDFTFPWNRTHRIRWEERWGKELHQFFSWRRYGLDSAGPPYKPPAGNAANINVRCPLLDWPGNAVWLFLRLLPCPSPETARRKAWFLMNSFSVVRLPDRRPVPVMGLSLSTDYDSWAWSLSMTLPDRETLALISPVSGTPWDVEVTINGHIWTAVVEGFEDRRSFGKAGFTVTGRSRAAYLAAPYVQARNFVGEDVRMAAQLAGEEVSESGWTVEWNPPDWLVPAGAYSYQGRTPIDAVAGLAGAVGGRLLSHRSDEVLRVISRYPVSPWDWDDANPDKSFSDNLVQSLALRWQATPLCSGVYVSGQNQGVLVNVKRAGTDGTPNGPMIVDPIITHVDAGRERGRVFLAGTGHRATITLELPLLPAGAEPGLLEPGQLVEVADGVETWKGLVTATTVDVGRPTVRQTVDLERFYL